MVSEQVMGRDTRQPFWKHALPLLLIAIGTVWLIGLGFRSQVSGERLWLIGAEVDLGKVKRNQVIAHRVWVFNPSLRTVVIEATPSCGCTVAELPYRQLTPLNGFPVEVQISTWGLPIGYRESVVGLTASLGDMRWQEQVVIRLEVVN
ncbi:MAG: hypothetical protein KatS3mg019_1539 [Fimbriimonadales bacterium]|nr:MAG: hypothetical protein KatS3mg019_1539 [Fimbriimonadales bacterium]